LQHYQSIINKTPLSAKTNRIIGGKAPSEYLRKIAQSTGISDERLDGILALHVTEPDAIRADDFSRFFYARQEALLARIENATGKGITRQSDDAINRDLEDEIIEKEDE